LGELTKRYKLTHTSKLANNGKCANRNILVKLKAQPRPHSAGRQLIDLCNWCSLTAINSTKWHKARVISAAWWTEDSPGGRTSKRPSKTATRTVLIRYEKQFTLAVSDKCALVSIYLHISFNDDYVHWHFKAVAN